MVLSARKCALYKLHLDARVEVDKTFNMELELFLGGSKREEATLRKNNEIDEPGKAHLTEKGTFDHDYFFIIFSNN